MKTFNSHLGALKSLQYFPRFPKTPKVVLYGAPNSGIRMFAHRLAIDLGVPAISLKNIYRTLLNFEDYYNSELFYRKVLSVLKNPDVHQVQSELESQMIPEKLLTLTKYAEMGYVLYDYPNSLKQAEKYIIIITCLNSLETVNGGVNLCVNLLFNKELSEKREHGKYECSDCGKEYNKTSLAYKNTNVHWPENYPQSHICEDCGSKNIKKTSNPKSFEEDWTAYEEKSKTVLPFYQEYGLLLNFEIKNGLEDYERLRQKVQYNIKH